MQKDSESSASKSHAVLLHLLTALFIARVCGQALQYGFAVSWLPPFDKWQGSSTPYPVLLMVQLLFVIVMIQQANLIARGHSLPEVRVGRWLGAFGAIYMLGSLLRIIIGLTIDDISPWFSAWISAAFHLVLAGYVLTLAHFHLQSTTTTRDV